MRPVTLVVPCYQEAARLDRAAFLRFVERHEEVGFLFVDDGSGDATGAVLAGMAAAAPHAISVAALPINRGKAEAVRAGMTAALEGGARYAGFWDADLATPLEAIPLLVEALDRDAALEAATGARVQLLGRTIVRRWRRHYVGRVFATAVSLMLRMPVYDTQCGAKLFRNSAVVRGIFARPFRTRWCFDVEILARLAHAAGSPGAAAARVEEVPLREWRDVAGSRLRARDFARAPLELWRVYRLEVRRPPPA